MEIYNNLISNIKIILQKENFSKKGSTFYIEKGNNLGMINFQKSKSSTSGVVLFTINIGVSLTILREFNKENLKQKPEIEDSHWRQRIGFLLPDKKDYWWKIANDTCLKQLTEDISQVLITVAIPEILSHLTIESLKSEWLNGVSKGITEFQRYMFLTTVLKVVNSSELMFYIEKLKLFSKGKAFEEVANEHIKLLGF